VLIVSGDDKNAVRFAFGVKQVSLSLTGGAGTALRTAFMRSGKSSSEEISLSSSSEPGMTASKALGCGLGDDEFEDDGRRGEEDNAGTCDGDRTGDRTGDRVLEERDVAEHGRGEMDLEDLCLGGCGLREP
jgi:hypothetical protein